MTAHLITAAVIYASIFATIALLIQYAEARCNKRDLGLLHTNDDTY